MTLFSSNGFFFAVDKSGALGRWKRFWDGGGTIDFEIRFELVLCQKRTNLKFQS